jgi:hypothetical protein
MMTAQATETNSTTSTTADLNSNANSLQGWGMGCMMTGDQEFGRGPRGHGGFMGGMGNIEVSSATTQTCRTSLQKATT